MTVTNRVITLLIVLCSLSFCFSKSTAQRNKKTFHVIAFYTGRNDQAHISFMHEANKWFPEMAKKYNFTYDSTKNWNNMNAEFLAHYQVVVFLDTRPDDPAQREAFKRYVENGGAWLGFHFSEFALTPSEFPQNWDWYHNEFLGSGSYRSNTWRPTSAVLRVEARDHPAMKNMPETFKSAPSEWYRWENDLRKNPYIKKTFANTNFFS